MTKLYREKLEHMAKCIGERTWMTNETMLKEDPNAWQNMHASQNMVVE